MAERLVTNFFKNTYLSENLKKYVLCFYKGDVILKALILTISTGQGHIQTGKAIAACFEKRGAKCEILDVYKYISPYLSDSVEKGYLFTTQKVPKTYGKVYQMLDSKVHKDGKKSFFSMINNAITASKLEKYIQEIEADVVISTHIFCAQVMTHIRKNMPGLFNIGIVTDFTIHPFWEEADMDYYITASHLLNHQCMKKGIPLEKVLPIGIPINEKFAGKISKREAREQLDIENTNTVMFMMGSMGFGNMPKLIKRVDTLDIDFQILCVCGRNEEAREKIASLKSKHKIYTYGYVDNIDVMMDASDFIITKPGGLSMSESLAKKLPTILLNPIPGQEDRNLEFFVNNGVSMAVSKTFPIEEAVFQMLTNQWKMKYGAGAVEYIGRPHAAAELYEIVVSALQNKL